MVFWITFLVLTNSTMDAQIATTLVTKYTTVSIRFNTIFKRKKKLELILNDKMLMSYLPIHWIIIYLCICIDPKCLMINKRLMCFEADHECIYLGYVWHWHKSLYYLLLYTRSKFVPLFFLSFLWWIICDNTLQIRWKFISKL